MTLWGSPPGEPKPTKSEVHLWRVALGGGAPLDARLAAALDAEERERARRFRFPRDRDRFVRSRGALRTVLGRYLGVEPGGVRFAFGPHGKPFLPGGGDLRFNLSHSGDWAVIAVAGSREVGVDVERMDAARAGEEIAVRFFSPEEVGALRRRNSRARTGAFFRCWTRKEAYLKALGEGLSLPLQSFAVSIDTVSAPRLLRSDRGDAEVRRWRFRDVKVAPGYAAAVVVEGAGWRPKLWRFSGVSLS